MGNNAALIVLVVIVLALSVLGAAALVQSPTWNLAPSSTMILRDKPTGELFYLVNDQGNKDGVNYYVMSSSLHRRIDDGDGSQAAWLANGVEKQVRLKGVGLGAIAYLTFRARDGVLVVEKSDRLEKL